MKQYVIKTYGISETRGFGEISFDPKILDSEADGLLAFQTAVPQLLTFQGPKAWYTCESLSHSRFKRRGLWKTIKKALTASEFLHYSSPDERYRVPHWCTSKPEFQIYYQKRQTRLHEAVATISNFGGRFWRLKKHLRIRNRFATCPLVSLYGPQEYWQQFNSLGILGHKKPPNNYLGEAPVRWHSTVRHYEWLSNYKVVVCLENRSEENYFTEKMPAAVMAGAIPVYHAHKSNVDTFLKGAKWIDPIDYGFDPEETIRAALKANTQDFQDANEQWLMNNSHIKTTTMNGIFAKIADFFVEKIRC
jgi:hypothetical protein